GYSLSAVETSALAWGDYDNDGLLDLAIAGYNGSGAITKLYHNKSGSALCSSRYSFPGVADSDLAWGDYDNDGFLVLAISGNTSSGGITKLYHNSGSGFVDSLYSFTAVNVSALAWGDYDNDGLLDLAIAGYDGSGAITKLYHN